MPELPEVETIVRELQGSVRGKEFLKVEGGTGRTIVPSISDVSKRIRGLKILDVLRQGKFIVFVLSGKMRLVVHLRMTGRLTWETVEDRKKYVRAAFYFKDGSVLNFSDVRKFGRIWFCTEGEYLKITRIGRLGREPLEMNLSEFLQLFGGRRGILKNNLLRQDILAGIGNIYADEICFGTGLHPSSRMERISKKTYARMFRAIKDCLEEGIRHCGVSVSDFAGTRGDLGKHQDYLQVYGRTGDKCYKCGSLIKKTVVAGRGTHFCPRCQKKN